MARYKVWDKKENIVLQVIHPTHKKQVFTPEEYQQLIEPMALTPGFEYIISNSKYNGSIWLECSKIAEVYRQQGLDIPENATPEEICSAIEAWEDLQREEGMAYAQAERESAERLLAAQIAACEAQIIQAEAVDRQTALTEFQVMMTSF